MKLVIAGTTVLFCATQVFGTVTLDIDQSGFENGAGVVSDGMPYAAVVDTNSDGFLEGSYLGFDLSLNGQFLQTNLGVSDDWFVYGGDLGSGKSPPTTANIFGVGNGAISSLTSLEETNINEGDEFALVWFPSGSATTGSAYGFATDTSSSTKMLVPGSGGISSVPDGVSTKSVDFPAIPEPSAYATILGLLGLGYAVFCRRRRSSSTD